MEAKKIDLADWTLSGGGAQGESYFSKTDSSLMLKLFNPKIPTGLIEGEITLSKEIAALGLPVPAPGELVQCTDGRYGITFRRIIGKQSFCTAAANKPESCRDLARRLAGMARELHSTSSQGTNFISACDYYSAILDKLPRIKGDERSLFESLIARLRTEQTQTLLHGDFHFGNAITDGIKDYFIDLGAFCYGNPKFDISMQYLVCTALPDELLYHYYHITQALALEFWDEFKTAYYGPDAPSDEVLMEEFRPYLIVRTLFFERDLGEDEFLIKLRRQLIEKM